MGKKKKKKKKNFSNSNKNISNNLTNVSSQGVESVNANNESVEEKPNEGRTQEIKRISKELVKVLLISAILLIILFGCFVVQSSSSWYQDAVNNIYGWMRLGKSN